eukprot:scaffold931_cov117-Isochrysis_galbana.AAC.9
MRHADGRKDVAHTCSRNCLVLATGARGHRKEVTERKLHPSRTHRQAYLDSSSTAAMAGSAESPGRSAGGGTPERSCSSLSSTSEC